MSNPLPKWNDERTAALVAGVADETPVSQETVARLADELETTTRSISSKLRKMGVDVATVAAAAKRFSDAQEAELRAYVEANSGAYTFAEIAEGFANGQFTSRQLQGKLMSMELTEHVKETPKVEAKRTYTDEEQATVIRLANEGAFIEDIAAAVGKAVASVRGKVLSLVREGLLEAMPVQRDVKGANSPDSFDNLGDVSGLTVAEIAEKLDKTERGVRTMLTRRGVTAKDWDGAKRAAKNAAAE